MKKWRWPTISKGHILSSAEEVFAGLELRRAKHFIVTIFDRHDERKHTQAITTFADLRDWLDEHVNDQVEFIELLWTYGNHQESFTCKVRKRDFRKTRRSLQLKNARVILRVGADVIGDFRAARSHVPGVALLLPVRSGSRTRQHSRVALAETMAA